MPGLNMTSTADISFMLLVFFLITTSMDSEKGLGRQLPPPDPEEQEKLQDVDKDKVLTLHLSKTHLTINDRETRVSTALCKEIREFIKKAGPSHIIELQIDRSARYDDYFHLQNCIVKSYKGLQDTTQRIQETIVAQ